MSLTSTLEEISILPSGNSDVCIADLHTFPLKSNTKGNHQDACVVAGRCVKNCQGYGNVCQYAAQKVASYAIQEVREMKERSMIFSALEENDPSGDDWACFPCIHRQDIKIGDKLGEGGFSTVNTCTLVKENGKKYAIKHLKRQAMVEPHHFRHGAADLAIEAYFLHVVEHPNIISLHGVSPGPIRESIASGDDFGFFIVIDKLVETLEQRIHRWKTQDERSHVSFLKMVDHKHKKRQDIHTRARIALSIASAMEYLHSLNVLFRDLKPDNIGFDTDGVVKLFDFGLAKELKPGMKKKDGKFKLTGNTGSRRYMAPEVAKGLPYDKAVDVYSFGILLWELCSLEKPFLGYSSAKHMQRVVMIGERPAMDSRLTQHWPNTLLRLIVRCWSPFADSRPPFSEVVSILQKVLQETDDTPRSPTIPTAATTDSPLAKRRTHETTTHLGGFAFLSPLAPRRRERNKTTGSMDHPDTNGGKPNNILGASRSRSWGFAH